MIRLLRRAALPVLLLLALTACGSGGADGAPLRVGVTA